MRSYYKVLDSESCYFVTSTFVKWIPIFKNEKYVKILIEAIEYNQQKKDLKVFAYVIMPDHFHLIANSENLTHVMQSIKSYSAKKIISELKIDRRFDLLNLFMMNKIRHKGQSIYQIWQEGFHPKAILNEGMFKQKADYIHMNPVRKGLVEEPEKWRYSSFSFYYLDRQVDLKIEDHD